MPEFVIRDADGQFLSGPRQWSRQFIDARTFDVEKVALAAATRCGVLCEVVEDFGCDTQRVIATVG